MREGFLRPMRSSQRVFEERYISFAEPIKDKCLLEFYGKRFADGRARDAIALDFNLSRRARPREDRHLSGAKGRDIRGIYSYKFSTDADP